MGRLSRNKGKVWEREVAQRFREVMPGVTIRRGLQSRGGTREVPDVEMPYFLVECKHGILTNPRGALAQAEDAVGASGLVPIAVTKDNRQEPIVTMRFDAFLKMVGEWWGLSEDAKTRAEAARKKR